MSKWASLFKQKNIGIYWGMFALTATQLSVLVGVLNLFLISVAVYDKIDIWLKHYLGIQLGFVGFACVIVLGIVVVLILAFKFAMPSYYKAFNDQFYRHDNPLRKDMSEIAEQNREIMDRLNKLESRLSRLR